MRPRRVVLPDPLAPRRPVMPGGTSRVTPSSASVEPQCLTTPLAATTGAARAASTRVTQADYGGVTGASWAGSGEPGLAAYCSASASASSISLFDTIGMQ